MSYHNLLFMDLKVPLTWPLPPSSSPSPNPSLSCPLHSHHLVQAVPASRHHISCCLTQSFGGSCLPNSDLYPNITSEKYPLDTSLAWFTSPYPKTSITTTWSCISYLFICLSSQLSCQNVSSPKAVTLIMVFIESTTSLYYGIHTTSPGPQTRSSWIPGPFHPKTRTNRVRLLIRGWQTIARGPNSVYCLYLYNL